MASPGVTGPTDLKLNSLTLTLFIVSEGLIFFAMFIAYYFLRIGAQVADQPWPPAGTPEINQVTALISLAALVVSSLVYHLASKSYQ